MLPAFELLCVALLLTPTLCAQEQVEFELRLEQLRNSIRQGDLEQASDRVRGSLFDPLDFVEMEDRFGRFVQKRLPHPK